MTVSRTRYFRWGIPDFDSDPWHSEFDTLVRAIDRSVYSTFIASGSSVWANSTVYAIGDFAQSPDDGSIWVCDVAHTSTASPTTFANDRIAHPTFWSALASNIAADISYTPSGDMSSSNVQTAIDELASEKANIASPIFTGNPRAPTATLGDNDTSIATTAFVAAGLALKADIASPVFTGSVGLPVGLVGTPSLYFAGDTTTGLYAPSVGTMAVTVGGVQKALFAAALLTISSALLLSSTLEVAGNVYVNSGSVVRSSTINDASNSVNLLRYTGGNTIIGPAGTVSVPGGTASTSNTTGQLIVTGGVGISGALYGGGLISAAAASGLYLGANVFVRTNTNYNQIYDTAGVVTASFGNATDPTNYFDNGGNYFRNRGGSVNFALLDVTRLALLQNTASTSTTTGTLVVTGGVGVSGALNVVGAVETGATGTDGYMGWKRTSDGVEVASIKASGAIWAINSGVTLQFQYGGGVIGSYDSTKWTILYGTASTSTTTGSLVVTGGVGVSGNIYSGALISCSAFLADTYNDAANAHNMMVRSGGNTTLFGNNKFQVSDAGNVVVGTAALATNATDGFIYVPTCAGAPTGVPTAFTGRVAMIFDTTNKKLYFYNGAWQKAQVTAVDAVYA